VSVIADGALSAGANGIACAGAIADRPMTPKTDAISIRRMSSPFKLQRAEP